VHINASMQHDHRFVTSSPPLAPDDILEVFGSVGRPAARNIHTKYESARELHSGVIECARALPGHPDR
jgi:hypothetical protein